MNNAFNLNRSIVDRAVDLLRDKQVEMRGRGVIILLILYERRNIVIDPLQSPRSRYILKMFRDALIHHWDVFEFKIEDVVSSSPYYHLMRRPFGNLEDAFHFIETYTEENMMSEESWGHLLSLMGAIKANQDDLEATSVKNYWEQIGQIADVMYALLLPRQDRINEMFGLTQKSRYASVKGLSLWFLVADNAPMAVDALSQMVYDPDVVVRRAVASSLYRCEDHRIIGLLKVMVADKSVSVRLLALRSLSRIDSLEVVGVFNDYLKVANKTLKMDILQEMRTLKKTRDAAIFKVMDYTLTESDIDVLRVAGKTIVDILFPDNYEKDSLSDRVELLKQARLIEQFFVLNEINIIATQITDAIKKHERISS